MVYTKFYLQKSFSKRVFCTVQNLFHGPTHFKSFSEEVQTPTISPTISKLCASTKAEWLNQPPNTGNPLTEKKQLWSTGSAIYRSLSYAISFRFSEPKRPLSQAFCRAGGRLFGLLSRIST